jgi:hypothetical protein
MMRFYGALVLMTVMGVGLILLSAWLKQPVTPG